MVLGDTVLRAVAQDAWALWLEGLIAAAAAIGLAWRARERRHRTLQKALSEAVRERTDELHNEKTRENERNRILEMLAVNEPLGSVLDATARLIASQIEGTSCAILLRSNSGRTGAGYRIGAAPGLSRDWAHALEAQYAVPFEVWQKPLVHTQIPVNPAWRVFVSRMTGAPPAAVCTFPIGPQDSGSGALLVFYPPGVEPTQPDIEAAACGQRLAGLAIEHSRLYDNLHFQANHDSLTGLPNRGLFEERLERALHTAESTVKRLAVLFIDLDDFKKINDNFSHRIGDLFLCQVADRLREALPAAEAVARFGGDEFTAILTDIDSAAAAEETAARVLETLRRPLTIEGHELIASGSVGIAIFPDDGTNGEQLLREADAAMYCAKNLGRNRVQAFATRNASLDRARMGEALRTALRDGWFVVHYQPKVHSDGKLAGVEALVRMNHAKYGLIPPSSFISVAEADGLILPLGAWVLDEVCRQAADWRRRGLRQVPVAVNVSMAQIARPDFAENVQNCLERHGIPPMALELELTESLLIDCSEIVQKQMRNLRSLGVRISIDDFGTGYSSLSYLHRLHVDTIKLDRSFVQSIDTDTLALRLVHAMIGVAQGLGLGVIAEGVETESQRKALITAGCLYMQGYLFARPLPAADLENLLRTDLKCTHDLALLADSLGVSANAEEEVPALRR